MRPFLLTLVAVLLAVHGTAHAAAPARTHDIVPEDYFDLISLGGLAVSPDGSWIAHTESRWGSGDEGRATDLWLVARDGAERRRLTFGGLVAGAAVWGPDGRDLWFLGRDDAGREDPPRDGSRQVWRVAAAGGEPVPVTRIDDGVLAFVLAPDGRALYYKVAADRSDEPWGDLRKKFGDLEYGHGERSLHAVRRLDLVSWRDEEVLPAERVIWEMALAPDGRHLAMITTDDNEIIFKEGWSRVEVADLQTGVVTAVTGPEWRDGHPSPYGWLDDLAWSGDSRALAFAVSYDGYATRIWAAEAEGEAWKLWTVARPDPINYDGGLTWRGTGRTLCYRGESLARVRVHAVAEVKQGGQGATSLVADGDGVVAAFGFDRKGSQGSLILETLNAMNDVYAFDKPDRLERLTNVNPQVDTWKLPQIRHVSWTGGDGDTVWGILELPPGYQDGDGPLPAVIELHGGPTSSTKHRLRLWIYGRALFPAKGYALLSPNYHGSTGYGDAFLEKLIGRENEIEVADIAAGTRWLIEQGLADPARIGVMGWSNGGYLTNCMIVAEPDLYAAASSGAGVLDMVIQWGVEDTPGHVINFVQGLPWQVAEHYRTASPLYGLDRVKTPTLIHVGGDDPRVPPAHSRALYRALRHYLKVPTELVVYPGEPHNLTTHANRLAKLEWDLAWFGQYLGVPAAVPSAE